MIDGVLFWLLFSMVLIVVSIGVIIGVFGWQVRQRNRVDPDVETLAPLSWRWAPTQPARLHRRLQIAVAPVRRIDTVEEARQRGRSGTSKRHRKSTRTDAPRGSAADLRQTVRLQAVQLDAHIVGAARQPRPIKRNALRALTMQVAQLEQLSGRLVQHHHQTTAPVPTGGPVSATPGAPTPAVLAEVDEQLTILEQAHREVAAIEQANGLLDPERLIRPSGPPAGEPIAQAVSRPIAPTEPATNPAESRPHQA